jgi:hypothetical protein
MIGAIRSAVLLGHAAKTEVGMQRIADRPSAVVRQQVRHRLRLSCLDDNVIFLNWRRRRSEQAHVCDSHRFFPDLCVGTANVEVTVAGAAALSVEDFLGLRTSRFDFC